MNNYDKNRDNVEKKWNKNRLISMELEHFFNDIYILLRKNFQIQFRHPYLTLIECIFPCILVFIVALLRMLNPVILHDVPKTYPNFSLTNIPVNLINSTIYFTPNNETINNIMKQLLSDINTINNSIVINAIGFNNSELMVEQYLNIESNQSIFCGIEFNSLNQKQIGFTLRFSNVPKLYKHGFKTVNWRTNMWMDNVVKPGPREPMDIYGGLPGYYREGFLFIQHQLTMSIANVLFNRSKKIDFELYAQRFPYPAYIEDNFTSTLNFIFPSLFIFSFVMSSVNLTKTIVNEKEKRLKESMKMMGLNEKCHFIAHFIKMIIQSIPGIILIIIIVKVKFNRNSPPLLITDFTVLFMFFFLYEVMNICFCFMISTFFSRANLAGIVVGFLFFLTYLPYNILIFNYDLASPAKKIAHCFLPNTDLSLGIFIILSRESRRLPAEWSNIAEPATPDDTLTLSFTMLMFVINSLIYLIVTWYVTLAFPGEYGVALPWYFPITKSYWFNQKSKSDSGKHWPDSNDSPLNNSIEPYPNNWPVGIRINYLSKTYDGGRTYSVRDLSLNIFENQITALLGHNGAGKTTTISMLCGLFEPSNGTAIINGFDIRTEMTKIRTNLGICPQSNLLFDDLTVNEHLEFYCRLKHTNLTSAQIKQEIETMVKKLDLEDKKNTFAFQLSGGMKRKLSVGIALIGGSKVVILDEPTSGMDVSARRFVWDLLLQEKKSRIIIITTHFMEEADILGDRIAIMDCGQLQCYGTSLYLKNHIGSGYHLRMEKSSIDIETKQITDIVVKFVSGAQLESSVGIELIYSLPTEQISCFETLLAYIETDLKSKIVNYGISITTMEEVFLKVGEHNQKRIQSSTAIELEKTNIDIDEIVLESKYDGLRLLLEQFYGLIMKRLIYSYRKPFLTAIQIISPLTVIIITILMSNFISEIGKYKNLELNLQQYRLQPLIKYFSNENNPLGIKYEEILRREFHSNRIQLKNIVDNNLIQMEILKSNLFQYNYEYLISAIFNDKMNRSNITALFNNQPFHTPAISLKYIDQTLIEYYYNISNLKLTINNYPFPKTFNETKTKESINLATEMQIIQAIIMAMSFLVSSFSVLIVSERVVKAKHLQKICGLRMTLYWTALFLIDYIFYLIISSLMIILIVLFKVNNLSADLQPWYLFIAFAACGLCSIPFLYVLSFIFKDSAIAYSRSNLILLLTGIITMVIDQITIVSSKNLNQLLNPLFLLIFPMFNISKIVSNLQTNYRNNKLCNIKSIQDICKILPPIIPPEYQNSVKNILPCCKDHCKDNCIEFEDNYFTITLPGIGLELILIFFSSLFYWLILAIIETNSIQFYLSSLKNKYSLLSKQIFKLNSKEDLKQNNSDSVDNDVLEEKRLVQNIVKKSNIKDYSLIIHDLVKKYGTFTAVDNISYSVAKGECFGLLGVNGAGKTTTFKMITGDEMITSGHIYINGFDAEMERFKTLANVGYCPQFDALLGELTGEETLRFYGRLRGLKPDDQLKQIKHLSRLLYFEMHLNKAVHKYSGGNKRKLSTAIAMLGNPAITFLDEPTSGVDPVARRCLWSAIGNKLKQNLSIVLTSHSMEECEALCKRLIIMVNGRIACIGSPLQLKKKFGNSYNLEIKIDQNDKVYWNQTTNENQSEEQEQTADFSVTFAERIENVKLFIENTFPTSELKSIHNNLLVFTIMNNEEYEIRCSRIFGLIEQNKNRLFIEYYSVSQTSLEQIFLMFARLQNENIIDDTQDG